ncbi:hypothetical protein BGT96224_1205 [Blumeria graminis f. sp. tritici 96224]|nr:hypothetical protein BGT96224_1205 [Blumeria graminis f. sp. tritici 96224]
MSFLDLSPSPEPSEADEDILFVLRAGDTKTSVLHNAPKNDVMNKVPNIPTHPIPSMQGAFAESFLESSAGYVAPTNEIHKSVATRRQILLSQSVTEPTHAARWRLKPGQQFHEFWKLMSQISFGIYLLLNGIARDEEQVMKILQVHVDEIDEFLETTLQDFNLAQDDIEERLKHLKLPLKNVAVFDSMMEDRVFRLQIVDGNEKIEHVISRTASAMNDALKDVQQGANACKEFTLYLAREQNNTLWKNRSNMRKVYEAMKGNVNGWYKAFPAPLLTPVSIKIPEQQFFLPVNASPHSPLQRPWTAGPLQNPLHSQPNSSNSNLSTYTIHSRRNGAAHSTGRIHTHTPSTLRNLPSAMGQSTMSDATSKGPRKKRSMFGWLKEQFSLSEEEKQAFEARKQLGEIERLAAERMTKNSGPDRRRWLDGKRIDERGRMSETREAKRIQ